MSNIILIIVVGVCSFVIGCFYKGNKQLSKMQKEIEDEQSKIQEAHQKAVQCLLDDDEFDSVRQRWTEDR